MADIYNLTNISTSDNLYQVTYHSNELTGGLWGLFVLIALCIVLAVRMQNASVSARITAALFITTILSFFFRVMDFIGDYVVLLFVVLTAGSFIVLYFSD